MSLHTDNDRGRWKNREPLRDPPPPPAANISSNVPGGKFTLRKILADVDDDPVSSDIPSAL